MNATKLKVQCTLRYRAYADRVEGDVTNFKEHFQIHAFCSTSASPQLLQGTPATEYGGATSSSITPGNLPTVIDPTAEADHLEEPLATTEVPIEGPPDELHLMSRSASAAWTAKSSCWRRSS